MIKCIFCNKMCEWVKKWVWVVVEWVVFVIVVKLK